MQEESVYRVFVGGLAPSIKESDIEEKFQSFGWTSDVYLVQKKDNKGEVLKTFGYLNLKTTEQKLKKCFAVFGQTKWKGHTLKVHLAKDDFMKRLRKEWETPEPIQVSKSRKRKQIEPIKSYEEYLTKCKRVKKLIPGIPIEGEKNWVVGKYGRPLPIVYLGKIPGRKVLKHDPSKHCHCVKRLPDNDLNNNTNLKGLTWNLEEVHHLQDQIKAVKRTKKKSVQMLSSKDKVFGTSDIPDSKENRSSEKKDYPEPDFEIDQRTESGTIHSHKKEKKSKRLTKDGKSDQAPEVDFEIVKQSSEEDSSKATSKQTSLVINRGFSESDSSDSEKEGDMEVNTDEGTSTNLLPFALSSSTPTVRSLSQVKTNTASKLMEVNTDEGTSTNLLPFTLSSSTPTVRSLSQVKTNTASKLMEVNTDEGTSTNLLPFTLSSSTPMMRSLSQVKTNTASKLSDSIVKQLHLFDSNTKDQKSTIPIYVKPNVSSCGDVEKEEEEEEEEEEELNKTNMFDFDFESSQDNTMKYGVADKNDKGTEQDKIEDDNSNNDDEEHNINMFDFEFKNLKNVNSKEFFEKMEFRWENDQDVSSSSDIDSLIESDDVCLYQNVNDVSNSDVEKKKHVEATVNENDSDENDEISNNKQKSESESESMNKENCNEITTIKSIEKRERRNIERNSENEVSGKKAKNKQEKFKNAVTEETSNSSETKSVEQNPENAVSEKKAKKKQELKDAVTEETSAEKDGGKENSLNKKEKKKNKKELGPSKHHKPEMSEEARQKSIEIRSQRTQKNKELIKNALRGLDTNQPSANRICFDDDDDDDDDSDYSEKAKEKKPGTNLWDEAESDKGDGIKIKEEDKNVVNFFEEEEENDVDRFLVKKQFQGVEGEKLFKMQLHYGGDERFRLDERFADSENDDDSPTIGDSRTKEMTTTKDDLDVDLEEEKERNLSLLGSILGKSFQVDKKNKTKFENSNVPYERYDPTKSDHTKLEVQLDETFDEKYVTSTKLEKLKEGEETIQRKKILTDETENNVIPEVSKERFYEVDTSLKSLFNSENTVEEKPATFTFLSVADDDELTNEVEDDHVIEARPIKELSWRKGMSEDVIIEDEPNEENSFENGANKTNFGGFFFFKENDERLEKGSIFKRTDKLEDITKQWEDVRQSLHDDFKKKHKDAVRRVRKMKEKRSLTRS